MKPYLIRRTAFCATLVLVGFSGFRRAGEAGVSEAASPASSPRFRSVGYLQRAPSSNRRYSRIHWSFRNIDVQTLVKRLKRFGVDLPVELAGQVTVRLSVGAPWRSFLRPSAYELEGDLSSTALTVAGLELQKLSVHLTYTDGALQLTNASFTVPARNGNDGTVSGTARMQVRPRGDLSVQLTVDRFPLATVVEVVPELAGKVDGTAAGQFSGQVPVDQVRDLSRWQAQGHVTLAQVTALGLPPAQATTDFRLAQGRATVTHLSAQLERAKVTGTGDLTLAAPYNFTARLRAAVPDLAWLSKLDAELRPPVSIAGNITLSADAVGALKPKQVRVRGLLDGRELRFENIAIDRVQVPYEGTLDRIRLNAIRISLYGGQVTANLTLPTSRDGNVGAGIRAQNVDLGGLASAALKQPQKWREVASGTLQMQAPATRLHELEAWSGQGQLALGQGNVLGIDVSQMTTSLRVDKGRLEINGLTLDSPLAQVTGSAKLSLTTPFGFGAALRMANVDFSQLNRLPVSLRLPVTVAGRAGISTTVQGALQPLAFNARGGVATRSLSIDGIVVDTLNLNYTVQAADDARLLCNWKATIDTNLIGVRIDRVSLSRASLAARLDEGTLSVSRLTTEGGAMRIGGSGRLGLISPHEFALKLNVVNGDIALANRLPAALRPPVTVAGVANTSANLRGQLDPLRIQGSGDFSARNMRADRARIDSLNFDFTADEETVKLSRLALVAYRGRLDGKIQVPIAEAAQGDIDLQWQRMNVGQAFTDLSGLLTSRMAPDGGGEANPLAKALAETRFGGWTWGKIAVQTPAGKLFDPATWSGEIDISLAALRVFGWSANKAFIRGRLADGQAELTRLAFDFDGTRLRGTASLKLAEPYNFQSSISLMNLRLADFNKLPKEIRPPLKLAGDVDVSVDAKGTLEPLEVAGKGSVKADGIEADGARLEHLAIDFSAEQQRIELTRFDAELYDGHIDGTAAIVLQGDDKGKVDFAWQDIDLGQLATDVAHLPVHLRGKVNGKLNIGIPRAKLADVAAWTLKASFETSPLVAESARIGQFSGRVNYEDRLLDYNVHGDLLRGTIKLAGKWQSQPPPNGAAENEGLLEIAGARLDALAPLFRSRGAFDSVTGQINVELRYQHAAETGLPSGTGDLAIDDLRLGGIALLDEVRGRLRVAGDRLEIVNLQGVYAGGALTASAVVFFNPARRGSFRADIDGAEIAEAIAPWPPIASKLRGTVDAQLRGFLGGGRPVQVHGAIAVRRGSASGLEFTGVRLPLVGSIDPASGRGVFQIHGATGQMATGRVVGDFDLTLASGLDLKGRGKFTRLDLRTLLRQSATASRFANGKVNGVYTLAGRNVRTVNDLTGTLKADLLDTQAMSLPVLQQTLPYLTGGVSGSTTFDQGTLRAHLARGVIRVDRFSLVSGSVQVYANGTVSLAGRLDLNVTAKTGQLNSGLGAVSLLASRIALVAAPPVGLLMEATQFLSNQVINLEVTGTLRSPTIRIRPLQLLGQEAAQFFLLQALP